MATAVANKKLQEREAGYVLSVIAKLQALRIALDRFDNKISTSHHGDGLCLTWEVGLNSKQEPVITVDREQVLASRYLFERLVGRIPHGAWLMRDCPNRLCVAPWHRRVLIPGQ